MSFAKITLLATLLLCNLSCSRQPTLQNRSNLVLNTPSVANRPPFMPVQGAYLIVIDPGHGGKDLGSEAARTVSEKELNLKTAKLVATTLREMGFQVKLTRPDDRFVSLKMRSRIANEIHADLFVSIHYNSASSPSAEGIEIFYYRSDHQREHSSKLLAENVMQKLKAETGAKSRGVKAGNLAVIRETTMPAILIECGFLTNPKECKQLLQLAYTKKIAKAIALGIRESVLQ